MSDGWMKKRASEGNGGKGDVRCDDMAMVGDGNKREAEHPA